MPQAAEPALACLAELEREAIQLAYFDGDTYAEVAEKLETPPGRVTRGMRDGLHQLGELAADGQDGTAPT